MRSVSRRPLLAACCTRAVRADGLGAGESAAIGRALEIGALLLADDRAARRHARESGLVVIGTVGVLIRAKRIGSIAAVLPLIERLRASGHRLSDETVNAALDAAGEQSP